MSDAEALAHNVKLRLRELYSDPTWIIEAGSWADGQEVRVVMRRSPSKIFQQDFPVEGFEIRAVLNAAWKALGPP